MSVAGIFGSIGRAVNTSVNIGVGLGFSEAGGKAGGLGTIASMAAVGAVAGAGSTLATDGTVDPITGAVGGGLIGAAAIPAVGITAGVAGNAAVGLAKMAPKIAVGTGKFAASASPFVLGTGAKVATDVGSSVWNVGKRMIDWDADADMFDKVKFTGPISGIKAGWKNNKGIKKFTGAASGAIINGKTILGATAAVEGMKKAWGTLQTAKMGQMTGVQTLTPRVPSYADNAGASGDLVFALNANRRG